MRALGGARGGRSFNFLNFRLEQESLRRWCRDGKMQRVRYSTERAGIIQIRGILTDESVPGGAGQQSGKPKDVGRRMHQQVQQQQER